MKRLLFSLLVLFTVSFASAQTVIEAKQVKAVDSLKLKTDWITNIIKDSSLTGATVRNFPSTDAVIKYIANRLAYTVKYSDTAGLIAGYVRETRFLDSLTAIQTRIQGKLTKSDADTYYPAIQRVMDSLTNVQDRIQSKLTKSDADTYYPAIQRMIDSLTAVQSRIQGKLTKADADTYYPAIQRMIDSLTAVQSRIQGKLTKSDADTYYPAIQRVLDSLTAVQSRMQTKQPLLGYTAENSANKATDFSTVNNVLYPTVQAVSTYIQSALTGVLKDRGNYDASGNTFPASGGSGSGGAIKTGDMWYISVGGTLGGKAVTAGAWVRSLTDAPGQTAGNWAIADGGFGFVPENVANKSTNTSLGTSNTAYPSQNAVKTYVDNATANASNWNTAYSWGNHASAGYPLTSGSYSNPSWITSLAWSKLTGVPSTFTPSAHTHPYSDLTGTVPTWNQNTTGNAATATNSTQWNGNNYDGSYSTGGVFGFMINNNSTGYWQRATIAQTQTALGLGSYAYRSSGLAELTGATFTGNVTLSGTLPELDLYYGGNSGVKVRYDAGVAVAYIDNYYHDTQASNPYGDINFRSKHYGTNSLQTSFRLRGWDGTAVFKYAPQVSLLTSYSHIVAGGFGVMYRDAYDSYITSNMQWRSDGELIAKYTTVEGMGYLALTGKTLQWVTYNGSVTGGTGYGMTTKFSVDGAGGVIANSFSGAGTGLTGSGNNFTAGYLVNRYATDANTIWQAGIYTFFNGSNVPSGDFGMISIPTFSGTNSSEKYNVQIGSGLTGDLKYRTTDIYGAGTWYSLLTSYNYTSYAMAGAGYSANQNLNTSSAVTFGSATVNGNVTGKTFSENTVTVSSAYTVASDVGTVFCDSHTYTVTLPSASSFPGREITIKRISSGVGTGIVISGVTLGSSESGGSLGCHGAAVYKSNGTSWYCIAYRTGGCD